jgi:hypothetical protein
MAGLEAPWELTGEGKERRAGGAALGGSSPERGRRGGAGGAALGGQLGGAPMEGG